MSKPIVMFILFALCGIIATEKAFSSLESCQPCVDILIECNTCIKHMCLLCVNDIENSKCSNCAQNILSLGDNLYCDAGIEYHRAACDFSCRARDNIAAFYRVGTCSTSTGKCSCYQ